MLTWSYCVWSKHTTDLCNIMSRSVFAGLRRIKVVKGGQTNADEGWQEGEGSLGKCWPFLTRGWGVWKPPILAEVMCGQREHHQTLTPWIPDRIKPLKREYQEQKGIRYDICTPYAWTLLPESPGHHSHRQYSLPEILAIGKNRGPGQWGQEYKARSWQMNARAIFLRALPRIGVFLQCGKQWR